MSEPNRSSIEAELGAIKIPYIDKTLNEMDAPIDVTIRGGTINVELLLGFPPGTEATRLLQAAITVALRKLPYVENIEVDIQWNSPSSLPQQKSMGGLRSVRNIIAVASNKGGVGKSTTAVNLALALASQGARTGILDADIYGPSLPTMLGIPKNVRPDTDDNKQFSPIEAHGLQTMSIGYLVPDQQALAWRGPMASNALNQMIIETQWQDLDYLLLDLPPGTGDIQLTLSQKIPLSGAIVVTTPQEIALRDTVKGIEMFRKVEVPILGIVENMALHICENCGHKDHIFGSGGGRRIAREFHAPLLGSLPVDRNIRIDVDVGKPSVITDPTSSVSNIYKEISSKMSAEIWARQRSSSELPTIKIVAD